MTLLAPSVKASAPAALRRPNSVISWPLRPLVSAAMGLTWTMPVSRARRSTKSTCSGSSMAGTVSGWHTIVVTPPAAAAWLAEAKVSRYSAPGSPMKARMSIRPGATTLPLQSITSVPSGTPAAPMPRRTSRTMPSAMRRSPGISRSHDGSTIRALVSRIGWRSDSDILLTRSAGCGTEPRAPPCGRRRPFPPARGSATGPRRRRRRKSRRRGSWDPDA